MADMIVAGAGTTAANGTYVENGTYEGNYQYVKSDGNLIRCSGGGSWVIGASNIYFDPDYGWQGTLWYISTTHAKTPDNLTYTRILAGTDPAPTVTAASASGAFIPINMSAQMQSLNGNMRG